MLCSGVAACRRYGVCTVRCVECELRYMLCGGVAACCHTTA